MNYNGKELRHELKYYINYHEYHYLKTRLATLLRFDENGKENGYHISSLYFDDMYHSALQEKEAGIEFRTKYRIRIYNHLDSKILLEKKDKCGELISKQSIEITKPQFYALQNGGNINFLLQSPSQMPKEMYGQICANYLRPAVIVDYHREVFVLDEGNVRITFDSDLQAGLNTTDLFSDQLIYANVLEHGVMILEIKFDDFLPDYVKKLLQVASHDRYAISKYVLCRRMQMNRNPITSVQMVPAMYQSFKEELLYV